MSDIEEPPTKVAKYEMSQTFTQPEEMETMQEEVQEEGQEGQDGQDGQEGAEGQEEWLSEGLLTDDDTVVDQDKSTTSQLDSTAESQSQETPTVQETNAKIDANIERTLNSMDSQSGQTEDPFDALLKQDQEEKKEESDGNDTDDLLRMLEDDDKSKKVKVMTKTKPKEPQHQNASSDDDDEFIYKGTTVKKLKVAKNALIQKYPTKAMPETTDDDETDASSEDVQAMQKMFGTKKQTNLATQAAAKPVQKQSHPQLKQYVPKKVVRVGNGNTFRQVIDKRPASSRPDSKSLLKPNLQPKSIKIVDRTTSSVKPEPKKSQAEHEEIINEEEFLEEDGFDLDEDFAAESDTELERRRIKQRIMKPEEMDEDMLSDAESNSEDDSLYDELPSSDSDDMDEWFTLDIRSERAGDYLPLLGSKAYELLSQEKVRVGSRLNSLRQSLASLSAGSKQQAEKLKTASQALAEIDDMLKAH
ncbi:hypothetical protein ABMA27_012593 [Loxostege sticticalis]|uniref:Uncharacterized protein n=1 Tax=Loxostege sticticalis TaxID=481309 RepID=A0ABR3GZ60_LOXSC